MSEQTPQRWRAFTAGLSSADHARLMIALGAGLREARLASTIATQDGEVDQARRHLAAAISQLTDALQLLQPPHAT